MNESTVYLRDGTTDELVEATLYDDVTDDHIKMWNSTWAPKMNTHCQQCKPGEKPEDWYWNWEAKVRRTASLIAFNSFSLVCQNDLQGLMITNSTHSARISEQFGKPLIYIEMLAAAPSNRPSIVVPPRFRGIGTVMMLAAIELSMQMGFKGRVGLHSLPGAENFYKETCNMKELGKDAAYNNYRYYEMTPTHAEVFCK